MRLPFDLVMTVIASIFLSNSAVAEWRQFRGPGGHGATSEVNLPLRWSETENLAWKTELPGYGASSPILLGDRLYVTCYSGYGIDRENPGRMEDLMLHLVCLKTDGKIVWDKHIQPRLPESERVRDHGYAAQTPATDGEHLYVFFGKTGVLKFDLNGKKLWQADVGDKTHGWGSGTSPVLYKNLVIINASVESGSLVAINKANGKEVWRAGGMDSSWNTPHLVDVGGGKQELVVSVKGAILAFDPDTGEPLWNCDGIPDYVCPSAISQEGIVYVIGGRTSRAIAIRAGGRGDVTETHRLWEAKAGANVVSPVIHDGHLYWVSDRNNIAYCVRMDDGEVVYAERFRGQPYASPLVGDGKLYIVTRSGGTYVLAAKPEFEQLAHNELEDRSTFNASPIVDGGKLFLRSDKYLYCIGN
ncbi:outer membrane protein assembly factor BamB family protein [Novipirellula artificiosorum]|uniref:Outer membrane biogenesis protein BamB n=1 Tax=Novipirellula artificiosorum TaxID=2528016 RepID=A0A5C6D172_9BACT|nr:PQQ-binding-like beta-propeller repeat protein [Novipirellula artificiosorum]TWU28946.1 outer membrane biogenesis protein BamB [Novipirellula artificiosorum]